MNHLAQARGSRLGENSWKLGGFSAWVVAQVGDLSFERRAISLRQGGLAKTRTHRASQCFLLVVSPKRELEAWAKGFFRLSEGPWLERDWCRDVMFSYMFSVVGCMIDWITLFKAWSMWICMYYLILWTEIGMLAWVKHEFGWLVEVLAWNYNAWEKKLWLGCEEHESGVI